MTQLEAATKELAADLLRVTSSPAVDFGPDGVDARIFAAKIEALGEQYGRRRKMKA